MTNPTDDISWKTYRTRFVVRAKPLTSALTFVDALGREHSGRKGDYLVDANGVQSIAPRRIFEDIYVPLELPAENSSQPPRRQPQSTAGRSRSSPRHVVR